MKRPIIITLFIIPLLLSFPAQASYNFVNHSGLKSTGEKIGYSDTSAITFIESYIGTILNTVFSVLSVIFFALILYAGFLWMTAQGNDSKTAEAKKILISSIIGLIIILASYAISYFIFKALNPLSAPEAQAIFSYV